MGTHFSINFRMKQSDFFATPFVSLIITLPVCSGQADDNCGERGIRTLGTL